MMEDNVGNDTGTDIPGTGKGSSPGVLFLPGATGDGQFWRGVGDRLPAHWEHHYLDWPGLGCQPPHPDIDSLDALYRLAESRLTRPSVLVAQSMGGVIALQLALRHPERVTCLVLTATSGGMDMASLGGADWRPDFLANFPDTARWFLAHPPDLSRLLPSVKTSTLLIWGDADPISPVAVGRHLATLLPAARLVVIPGGQHSLAADHPGQVADLILEHVAHAYGNRMGAQAISQGWPSGSAK